MAEQRLAGAGFAGENEDALAVRQFAGPLNALCSWPVAG